MSITWGSMDKLGRNTQSTIDKAVIRNETGKLQVWQCRGKLSTQTQKSLHQSNFDNKTVGDVLNRLKMASTIRKIVLG